jgi:hypothetical protein
MEEDIIRYLQSIGQGTVGTNLFKGFMPEKPDTLTVVKIYDSLISDLAWNGEYPIFQVATRGRSYDEALTRAQNVYEALHGLSEVIINGTRYLLIQAIQVPMPISKDKTNRCIFTTNFSVMKEI